MKKNKMMRIASVLLVAVLVSACAISGTFAKYVTEGDAIDSARVAKFGVVITGSSSMFDTEYEADDPSFTESTLSVKSSTSKELVAPGTEGEMASFDLEGTPEVAVRITYAITDFDLSDDWTIVYNYDTYFYCPLEFTIGTTTVYGVDYSSEADLKAAVIAAAIDTTRDCAPLTDLSTIADTVNVSWKWNFEASTTHTPLSIEQNDDFDTQLGNKAAAGDDDTLTVSITTTCTVTQID